MHVKFAKLDLDVKDSTNKNKYLTPKDKTPKKRLENQEVRIRRNWLSSITIFYLFIASVPTLAKEVVRRQISLEFESIEGVSHYEVELTRLLTPKQRKKPALFKTQGGTFTANIQPGAYEIRQRSVDDRGVPGPWSEPTPIEVPFPAVELVSPPNQSQLTTTDEKKSEVQLEWKPVEGAATYRLEVQDNQGQAVLNEVLDNITHTLELPVAATYSWRVTVETPAPKGDRAETQNTFTLLGAPLPEPEITLKTSKSGLDAIEWSPSPVQATYQVTIHQKKPNGWNQVEQTQSGTPTLKPNPKWTKGRYRIEVKATAALRQPSSVADKEFDFDGFLTPKQKLEKAKTVEIKESQRLPTNWYGIASYLLTTMNFNGVFRETDTQASFNAIGGTGRLGLGYQRHSSRWGALGIIDLSGFIIDKVRYQFASAEALATWMPLEDDRLKLSAGAYYKEFPASVGSRLTSGGTVDKVSVVGPTAQVLYLQPLTARLGFAVLAQGYYSLLKAQTPNGRQIKPQLSSQYGLLGTLRLSPKILGYAGYVTRTDSVVWEATSYDDLSSSFASPGEVNTVTIKGNYLNFILHVSF